MYSSMFKFTPSAVDREDTARIVRIAYIIILNRRFTIIA